MTQHQAGTPPATPRRECRHLLIAGRQVTLGCTGPVGHDGTDHLDEDRADPIGWTCRHKGGQLGPSVCDQAPSEVTVWRPNAETR